jgi:mono/diheme cytochrome c family protein
MRSGSIRVRALAVAIAAWVLTLATIAATAQDPNPGWRLPPGAAAEKNPFPVNEALLAAGRKVFVSKCVRCHGPKGEGDGEDADTDLKNEMNLTRADRAAANPDGIVLAKVWNGREEPRMPSFEDQLSKEQAWAVVAYVQTLRKKQ